MARERKPKCVDRFEISLSIPLFSKSKQDRWLEVTEKLNRIENAISGVEATYEIASHTTNEER